MAETSNATGDLHELATEHIPAFVPLKGETDSLFVAMIVFVVIIVLVIGNLYFKLHALPERMAHKSNLVQFQFIAVLSLLALFTHNNIFWVAALLIALVKFPERLASSSTSSRARYNTPVSSIGVLPPETTLLVASPPSSCTRPVVCTKTATRVSSSSAMVTVAELEAPTK